MRLIVEIIIIGISIVMVAYIGFHIGVYYQKKSFEKALWGECIKMKDSFTKIKRLNDLWIMYQGGVHKKDCRYLYNEDFCTVSRYKE